MPTELNRRSLRCARGFVTAFERDHAIAYRDTLGFSAMLHSDSFGFEPLLHELRNIDIFRAEELRNVFDNRDFHAETTQRLPQLAPNRAATEYDHALGL